jgi:hypothetical protein
MDSVWDKFMDFYVRLSRECKTRLEHEVLKESKDALYGKFMVKYRAMEPERKESTVDGVIRATVESTVDGVIRATAEDSLSSFWPKKPD